MTETVTGEQDPGGDPSFPNLSIYDEQQITFAMPAILRAARRTLELLAVPVEAALVVTFVGADRMADLKESALGERAPTDVLAFPIDDPDDPMPGPFVLGDVVICPEVAAEQAREARHGLDDELRMLLVHGILHCLGRDHATPDEQASMFAEQAAVLRALEPQEAKRS